MKKNYKEIFPVNFSTILLDKDVFQFFIEILKRILNKYLKDKSLFIIIIGQILFFKIHALYS